MRVEAVPIGQVTPYVRNPRKNEAAVAKVAASIKEFGWRQPIVVDTDMVVVVGHTRLLAARQLGLAEVPVHVAEGLSPTQCKAYRLMDNRSGQEAEWDENLLSLEFADLKEMKFDLELTGFEQDEIAALFGKGTEGLTDPDEVPEAPEDPVTKPGDLITLGNHRLLCGDATKAEDVAQLMGGQKADMVFTDPPYNVDYSGRGQNSLGKIKNDSMTDDDFSIFLDAVFASFLSAMKPLACIYVCHPDSATGPKVAFELSFGSRFHKSSTIIWLKQSAGMGWQDYRCQHEPILYGWKGGDGKHFFAGDRTKTTVWNIGRDAQATYKHPTQKPVALVAEAIFNSSKGEDVVLDLFGGSGTTLLASEQSGRTCRMMELDPKFCDVIVQRWENFTGKKAERPERVAV